MKKVSTSTRKKPAAKRPTAKKSSSKPKRKAEQHSQLAQVVTRLELVADKLAQTAEHLPSWPLGSRILKNTRRSHGTIQWIRQTSAQLRYQVRAETQRMAFQRNDLRFPTGRLRQPTRH